MKKTFYILAAYAACFAISCNKEITTEEPINEVETPEVEMQTITIKATIDDIVTKSYYAGGTTFNWNAGDEISVYCSDGNFYTFSADGTGTSTTFTGAIPAGKSLGAYAFFPADAGHTHGNFYLPSYKDVTSHTSADIPMVGLKGGGDVYSFAHCAGAALLTIENVPDGVTSATITVESYNSSNASECYKLSGSFYIHGRELAPTTTTPNWDGDYAATDAEKQFSRKVTVTDHTAQLYIPCPAGADNWVPNKLTVIGHTSGGNVTLYDEKAMKNLGTVARAHVLPLKSLVYSQLGHIDWSGISGYTGDGNYAAFKVTSDEKYVYFYSKVKKEQVKWGTTDGAGENGSYIYYGVDTDQDPATGNDFWGNAGKFDSIVLYYPYNLGETIRTSPYVKVNGARAYYPCYGTIEAGEGAMVETEIGVLRTDLGVSKGSTVNVYSYVSSNVSQYSSEFAATL